MLWVVAISLWWHRPEWANREVPASQADGSICFQVPAMTREHGVTIVVAPLIGVYSYCNADISSDERPSAGSPGYRNPGCDAMRGNQV
jgi:hypothetical protein